MSDKTTQAQKQQTGYARALFEKQRDRWSDDRILAGDKMDIRYHNKEKALKIVNGLCHDIFFRAEDMESDSFEDIPDFSESVPEDKLIKPKGKKELKKPLDSKFRERTYILNPNESEKTAISTVKASRESTRTRSKTKKGGRNSRRRRR